MKKKIISRLSYSFGAFGNDVFYATLSTYFIVFVTTHLFNSGNGKMIFMITNLIAIIRISEVLIDPLIGNAIDRTVTRWGKFKPWVVAGGIISSLALLALFTDLGGTNKSNPILYFILFGIIYLVMDIFYSFKDTGFWSMIPALSLESREREKTATFARIGSTLGVNIVGVVIMPIVLFFSASKVNPNGDKRGWFWFAFIVAVIGIASAIAVGLGTHEVKSKLRENKEKTTLSQVFKVLTKNDQLMWLALAYWFYGLGINTLNALQLYYFSYILGNASGYTILYGINTFVGLISVSLFPSLAKEFNRKRLFYLCIATMLVGISVFSLASGSLIVSLIGAELFFIPQPLAFLVVLMIISDAVEYGQLKTNHRDEALTLSVRPLVDKLGGAMSNWFVSMVAVLAGMTTGATAQSITDHGKFVFKLCMFGFPAIMLVIAVIIFAKKVLLTEEKHAEIVNQLERKLSQKYAQDPIENQKSYVLTSPISGVLLPLKDLPDQVFATEKMGKGFVVIPSSGKVFSPFAGEVKQIAPTRHFIVLESEEGMIILIHIGLNTVKLNGTGFTSSVSEGDKVESGQEILEFWDPYIKKQGYDDSTIITVVNSSMFRSIEVIPPYGKKVAAMDTICILEGKSNE
ncbi:glycoside-pentoside-hexuronide (GPH):cation symporter [Lactobacillus agrestimuris]|uniref:glycoside-pentoside-hexuronide (GPH):cation symporter n=1 Tax=Lactobacillus agrestimuris TaxID=2941328 RepID=UPI002043BBCA|nr:glycoside-pentoside-hexuronide (GPH):cation symporter [Lactobacillus agrestimuris]